MSFLVFGLLAAACGASAVAATTVLRRRLLASSPSPRPALPAADAEETATDGEPDDDSSDLPAYLDDVIQVGDETRWPRSGMLLRAGGVIQAAVLLGDGAEAGQATVALPPPDRTLLWLETVPLTLPRSPPPRIEIDGFLLDRVGILPVTIERIGRPHDDAVDGEAVFVRYRGKVQDEAVALLHSGRVAAWYGRAVSDDAFEALGRVSRQS